MLFQKGRRKKRQGENEDEFVSGPRCATSTPFTLDLQVQWTSDPSWAAQKGNVIGRVCLLLLLCTTIMKRDACVYIGCVSGFVLQPMLRGNHVSRSAISDSELQARKRISLSSGNKAATMGLKHNKPKQETTCLEKLSQTDKS